MSGFVVRCQSMSWGVKAIVVAGALTNNPVRVELAKVASTELHLGDLGWAGHRTGLRVVCRHKPEMELLGANFHATTLIDECIERAEEIAHHIALTSISTAIPLLAQRSDAILGGHFQTLDAQLLSSMYLASEAHVTAADIALACVLFEGHNVWRTSNPLQSYPNICRWLNTCRVMPFFRCSSLPPSQCHKEKNKRKEVTRGKQHTFEFEFDFSNPTSSALEDAPATVTVSVGSPSPTTAHTQLKPHFSNEFVTDFHKRIGELGVPFPVPMDTDETAEKTSWAKSLFVSGKKGSEKKFFMLTIPSSRTVDLPALSTLLGAKNLRIASAEDMARVLNVAKGCVTAMTTSMDKTGQCTSVIDHSLLRSGAPLRMCVGCNDALDFNGHNISSCSPDALLALLSESNHNPILLDLDGASPKIVTDAPKLPAPVQQTATTTTPPPPPSNQGGAPTKSDQETEAVVLRFLESHGVIPEVLHHESVKTIPAQIAALEKLNKTLDGVLLLKNLFLKGKKGQLILVSARHTANADLKLVSKKLALPSGSLRFGPADALLETLGVEQGAVTPLALMNDTQRAVTFVLDSRVANSQRIFLHPNHNSATIELVGATLIEIVRLTGHEPILMDFEDL
eukprot:c16708_g1_i3.p1 GENE.c16708_g1_i3~~c16708_g1_i3.p1  ORF type:complete len:624 (+),score=144.17 c16708_g1_i3:36-1907(+)